MNKAFIKRLLSIICIITVCFALYGCNAGVIVHNETVNNETVINDIDVNIESNITENITVNETNTKSQAEATEKTSSANTETTSPDKRTSSTTGKAGTTETQTTASTPSTTKASTSATSTSKRDTACSLTIECTAILGNMDKLKEGHEQYVPSSGYILNSYKIEYTEGDTAYDILKRACSANGIKLNARSSQYGTYVAGINNLDEFDCGNMSGWLYAVNGTTPGLSCGKYKVSPGDSIKFFYTCNG